MVLLRRLTLVASIVFCGSMALAAAAFAAGGPPTSGESTFTSIGAQASVGTKGGTVVFVFVSRSSQTFDSGSSNNSGKVVSDKIVENTQVFIDIFDVAANTDSSGCFAIRASDFNVDRNLHSASLETKLTKDTQPCTGKGGKPFGAKAGAPAPGGGGPPTIVPLTLPINLDMTWAGNGVVSTSRSSNSFQCLVYSTQFSDSVRMSLAVASGTISVLSSPFSTPGANISSDQSHQEFSGVLSPACLGGSGG